MAAKVDSIVAKGDEGVCLYGLMLLLIVVAVVAETERSGMACVLSETTVAT